MTLATHRIYGDTVYLHAATRRFCVSADPYSRARVRFVHALHKEWNRFSPPYVACSLFGSLTKGKILTEERARNTDIDLAVIYDGSRVERPVFERRLMSIADDLGSSRGWYERMGFPPNAAYALWRSMVFRDVRMAGEGSLESLAMRLAFPEKEWSPLPTDCGDPEWAPDYMVWGVWAARCFHLDVGGGLKRYRRTFLRKLARDPAYDEMVPSRPFLPTSEMITLREYVWRQVIKETLRVERLYQPGATAPNRLLAQYPATFESACRYYLNCHA